MIETSSQWEDHESFSRSRVPLASLLIRAMDTCEEAGQPWQGEVGSRGPGLDYEVADFDAS